MKLFCKTILHLLFFLFVFCPLQSEPVLLDNSFVQIPIGKSIFILEDIEKKIAVEEVIGAENLSRFTKSKVTVPGFGLTESAFWIYFSVKNTSQQKQTFYLEVDQAQFDYIDFYEFSYDFKLLGKISTGDQLNFTTRPVEHFNFVFPIELEPDQEKNIYMRMIMNGPTIFPLRIWSGKEFFLHTIRTGYVLGAFLGIMGIMFIYNLFIYFSVKDISYILYILIIGCLTLVTITFFGLDAQYVWHNSPFLGEWIQHFGVLGAHIFTILFTIRFLNVRFISPLFYKIFLAYVIADGFAIFLPFILPILYSIQFNVFVNITSMPLLLTIGFIGYKKGQRAARFYLLSWTVGILSVITFILTIENIISDSFFTRYALQFSAVLQSILFAFALADRINILKEDREIALLGKLSESEKNASLSRAFERFVPKQFLEYLEKESIVAIQLGDNIQKNMTILFCDIRSFTDMSETMTPNDNFLFINEYLSRVGPLIRASEGFIDKYIGDAIMALFPENVESAIRAAVNIQREVKKFNMHRKEKGEQVINIGIGIHTGNLMLGTVGEENRMDTTVISDSVNLASRIEGLTKELNAPIIISGDVFDKLVDKEKFPCRRLGKFPVKGKKEAIELVEIIEGSLDFFAPEKVQTKDEFEKAIQLYEETEFEKSKKGFQNILEVFPDDLVSKIYIQRINSNEKKL